LCNAYIEVQAMVGLILSILRLPVSACLVSCGDRFPGISRSFSPDRVNLDSSYPTPPPSLQGQIIHICSRKTTCFLAFSAATPTSGSTTQFAAMLEIPPIVARTKLTRILPNDCSRAPLNVTSSSLSVVRWTMSRAA